MTTEKKLSHEQEFHLLAIKTHMLDRLDVKYRKGASEHGDNLWDHTVSDIVEYAIEEVVDLMTYLDTAKDIILSGRPQRQATNVLLVQQLPGFMQHPTLKLHHDGDVGYDLYACMLDEVSIEPYDFQDLPCGIAVKLPPDTWAMVHARSSTFWRRRLLVHNGIIDNGYTGPLHVGVWNPTNTAKVIRPLESLAQLIIMSSPPSISVEYADALPDTDRGQRGFGSTGGISV